MCIQKKYFYGYKLHSVCSVAGVIQTLDLTKASVHDVQYLNDVKVLFENCMIIGDKGYISKKQQISLFHERVLPDLDNNIKCGNSLIDTDFYDDEMDLGFDKKIKPFRWQLAFPEIFKVAAVLLQIFDDEPTLLLLIGLLITSIQHTSLESVTSISTSKLNTIMLLAVFLRFFVRCVFHRLPDAWLRGVVC